MTTDHIPDTRKKVPTAGSPVQRPVVLRAPERAAFEAWLNPGRHAGNVSPWVKPGRYEKETHQLAWLAWRACRDDGAACLAEAARHMRENAAGLRQWPDMEQEASSVARNAKSAICTSSTTWSSAACPLDIRATTLLAARPLERRVRRHCCRSGNDSDGRRGFVGGQRAAHAGAMPVHRMAAPWRRPCGLESDVSGDFSGHANAP